MCLNDSIYNYVIPICKENIEIDDGEEKTETNERCGVEGNKKKNIRHLNIEHVWKLMAIFERKYMAGA